MLECRIEYEAYEDGEKAKRTREGKETLIIKIYVHNVVTCFLNFFCPLFSFSLPQPSEKAFLDFVLGNRSVG